MRDVCRSPYRLAVVASFRKRRDSRKDVAVLLKRNVVNVLLVAMTLPI
jgi:hypothetical protein